jgi:hypothetical protein
VWAVGSLGDCPFEGWHIFLAPTAALSLLLHDGTLAVVARAQVAAWHQARSRLHEGGIGHVFSRSAEYLRTSCSHLELTKNTVSIPEWRWRWRSEGASRGGLAGSCHVPMRDDGARAGERLDEARQRSLASGKA